MSDELRDSLPDDLNVAEFVGAYKFPDNSRRRIPGVLYLVVAGMLGFCMIAAADSSVYVNGGAGFACALLLAVGVFSITSGWRMAVDEKGALVIATREAGFTVGHASAQQVWRGFRSRPTWRVLCYSAEEPPLTRALVLVDAVNGRVVESLTESNPESGVTAGPSGSD